ncbi:MAG: hypothetical protein ATN36_02765 [Epulopiscium sp. Nele67-Bin005]|nr:MAG: hypothetical protein ATN36_02765 [Epulopiscium sp. Nele67-Bin005]
MYPNGARKALTFSYDDGIYQDERLISILDKYNLKCTFNLNSGLLNSDQFFVNQGKVGEVKVQRVTSSLAKKWYSHHEVACHTINHPELTELSYEQKVYEIEVDKKNLEQLFERQITGMAYPFGRKIDDETIGIMKDCGIKYGRLAGNSESFLLPEDWYRWLPTAHHNHSKIFDMIDEFLNYDGEELIAFSIWGHSNNLDEDDNWETFINCAQLLSNRDDIWYCTNIELVNFLK